MTIISMTGFGRDEGATTGLAWTWELRSVNGRGLDVRLRLPPGYDSLEPKVRECLQANLSRGSVTVNLTVRRIETSSTIRVNREAIAAVAEAVALMRAAIPGETHVSIDGLLALRGVLEEGDRSEPEADSVSRVAAMLSSLERAVTDLKSVRRREGARLEAIIVTQLDDVSRLVETIRSAPCRTPEAIRARLAEQIARLTGTQGGATFDIARLHQEAMLIATKVDVEEELQRLSAHVAAARDLVADKEPIGRKFDFLTQEFNREANTLCSKANDVDITRSGLAMKAIIDQMREQVQNIE